MKKVIVATLLLALALGTAFSQIRIDIGVDKPMGIGVANNAAASDDLDDASDFIREQWWLFLPTAGAYYQFDLAPIKLGVGIRAYTFLVLGAAWPNVYAELPLGPFFLDAQVGGLLFGYYALNNGRIDVGNVFVPDLSAWLGLGKTKGLRLGAGVLAFYAPDTLGDSMPFMPYIGLKITIMP